MPCADYVASDDDAKIEISQVIGDDHKHQDSDLCPPFCICQCCHISVTYFKSTIKLEISDISTQNFLYLNGTEKDFTTSILQPPRI